MKNDFIKRFGIESTDDLKDILSEKVSDNINQFNNNTKNIYAVLNYINGMSETAKDKDGFFFVENNYLSKLLDIGISTVIRCINNLVKEGILLKKERLGYANRYKVVDTPITNEDPTPVKIENEDPTPVKIENDKGMMTPINSSDTPVKIDDNPYQNNKMIGVSKSKMMTDIDIDNNIDKEIMNKEELKEIIDNIIIQERSMRETNLKDIENLLDSKLSSIETVLKEISNSLSVISSSYQSVDNSKMNFKENNVRPTVDNSINSNIEQNTVESILSNSSTKEEKKENSVKERKDKTFIKPNSNPVREYQKIQKRFQSDEEKLNHLFEELFTKSTVDNFDNRQNQVKDWAARHGCLSAYSQILERWMMKLSNKIPRLNENHSTLIDAHKDNNNATGAIPDTNTTIPEKVVEKSSNNESNDNADSILKLPYIGEKKTFNSYDELKAFKDENNIKGQSMMRYDIVANGEEYSIKSKGVEQVKGVPESLRKINESIARDEELDKSIAASTGKGIENELNDMVEKCATINDIESGLTTTHSSKKDATESISDRSTVNLKDDTDIIKTTIAKIKAKATPKGNFEIIYSPTEYKDLNNLRFDNVDCLRGYGQFRVRNLENYVADWVE